MKNILSVCCLLAAVTIAHAQSPTDWKQLELKGKVKSLSTQQTYRYKKAGEWLPWEKTYAKDYLFNNKGRYTEYMDYGLDGKLSYSIIYTYTAKNTTLAFFDKEGKAGIKKIHVLDDKGRVTEEIEYTKDGVPDRRYANSYDEKGNKITVTGYKADGTMTSKITYTYDAGGRMIGYLTATPGYANSSRKYVLDEKGNTKEDIWYNGQGAIEYRYVRTYDEKGNKIEELTYKGKDELRNMIRWKYEYDKNGNWTKRTESNSEGIEFHIEERKLTYY